MVAVSAGGAFAAGAGLLFSPLFRDQPTVMAFGGVALAVAVWCVWQLLTGRLHPVPVMAVVAVSMAGLGMFTSHSFRLAITAILVLYAAVGAVIIAHTGRFWAFTTFVGAAGGFPNLASHLGWVSMVPGESAELLIEGIVFWTAAGIFRLVRDEIWTRDQHNRSKDAFLARVAHELRTPLTSVLGYAELIAEDPGVSARIRDQGEMIASEGRAMTAVIDDFNLVARTDDDLLALKPAVVPAIEQVRKALTWLPDTKIPIRISGSPDAVIHVDPDRLRQMLRVLITNAVQHAESSVEVTIRRGETTIIEIIDDGPGISKDVVVRFTEAYHSTHQEPGQPEHIGLGLFVVHRLGQAMGVRVIYDRREGYTVFSLEGPKRPLPEHATSLPGQGGLEKARHLADVRSAGCRLGREMRPSSNPRHNN